MGTQYQRLTTPRAWGTQAVQTHSAWNLEDHHVISQARLKLPEMILEASPTRAWRYVWPCHPKTESDRHPHLCPELSPSGRPLPCCEFGAWNLLGHIPNPKTTSIREPPMKPKRSSNPNPTLVSPGRMGPHFSTRGRSRERSAFGTGDFPGPNSNPS